MSRQFDKYCQEMAMEDLESEVPQEWNGEEARRPMREYYRQHKTCPVCGSLKHGQTYAGFLQPPDTNKAWCSCGWSGIVNELKPPKED